jgi:hypothetical protein
MPKYAVKIMFFCFVLLTFTTSQAQCAMCRAVLESEADNSMAEGVNNGIVYLMAIPYILVGGLAFLLYRKYAKG